MTSPASLRAVLITQDPGVRAAITSFARDPGNRLAVVLDLDVPLLGFNGAQFKAVSQAAPALVFVDFDGAPDLGVSLARDLARADERLLPVGIGDALSSDLLLQAIRAGLAEFLVKPLSAEGLSEALARLLPRMRVDDEDTAGALARTVAFFSAKGGSGASTAVTNLAIELHRITGKRTLLVDLDAELGEISLLLGTQPQFNFTDLIQNLHRMDANLLGSYIEQHSSGVHLLSAPYHPERASGFTGEEIRQALHYLRAQYDWVLIDTSKSFSPETLAAFEQCDDVFLLATVDLPSLRNIQRALPLLKRVMPRGTEQLHLVINRYDPTSEISLKDVERSVGMRVFATLANDYDVVIRSVNTAKPVVIHAP
ncbi:MAG: response regulator receiver protein [Gemmatimonadetes bacterium]|nr:response regulator receiver protein [Gemmatimonadota bacterium]